MHRIQYTYSIGLLRLIYLRNTSSTRSTLVGNTIVASDALVLKHQATRFHSAD